MIQTSVSGSSFPYITNYFSLLYLLVDFNSKFSVNNLIFFHRNKGNWTISNEVKGNEVNLSGSLIMQHIHSFNSMISTLGVIFFSVRGSICQKCLAIDVQRLLKNELFCLSHGK